MSEIVVNHAALEHLQTLGDAATRGQTNLCPVNGMLI